MSAIGRFLHSRARFTLTGMLLVVGVLSIALAHQANRVARQRRAIAAIKQAGGWFLYDSFEDDLFDNEARHWDWALLRRAIGDDWIEGVARVYLSDTRADDETLRALADLPELRKLYLRNTATDDDGLARLAGLKRLQVLDLGNTLITDEGLSSLDAMAQLQELSLDDANVSDEGIRHLMLLPRLAHLDVSGTHVTPGGVEWFPRHRGEASICGGGGDDTWGWYAQVMCSAD